MTDTNGTETTALAVADRERHNILRDNIKDAAAPRAIVPRSFSEAQSFAGAIAASNLVPAKLSGKAPDVLMMVLAGAELGIAPVRSLSMFHVIEGVPKLTSEALAAIVMASPLCEYLRPLEQANDRVTWEGKRVGAPPVKLTITQADMDLAGLSNSNNHKKFPRQMKNARCRADLCRLVWPDICAGLLTAEEAEDIALLNRDASPTFVAPEAPRELVAPKETPPAGKPPKAAAKEKAAPKAIDAASSEKTPASGDSSSAAPKTSEGSSAAPTSKEPAPNGSDAGAKEALDKARENARVIQEERDKTAPSNTNDTSTDATPEDSFGGDEPAAPPARTFARFESELAEAVATKDPARLAAVKTDWIPWSKVEGDGGGKVHAHAMRDAFARAQAAVGAR